MAGHRVDDHDCRRPRLVGDRHVRPDGAAPRASDHVLDDLAKRRAPYLAVSHLPAGPGRPLLTPGSTLADEVSRAAMAC